MSYLLLYFGLVFCVLLPILIYDCWRRNSRFSLLKYPLSYMTKTHTAPLFAVYCGLITLIEAVFIIGIFIHFPFLADFKSNLFLYVGLFSMILTGIISSRWNKKWHFIFGFIAVSSIILWTLCFHLLLILNGYISYGIIGLFLTLIATISFPLLKYIYKNYGPSELVFITIALIWNILITSLAFIG